MSTHSIFSFPLLAALVAVFTVAFAAQWAGRPAELYVDTGLSMAAASLALYVANRSAPPSELGSRRLVTIAAFLSLAAMVTG